MPNERGAVPISCQLNPTPENHINFDQSGAAIVSDIIGFANFMRSLAPPTPSTQGIPGNPSAQSVQNGQVIFSKIHCDTCHTPSLPTASSLVAALGNQTVPL